jgi:pyridinium-3,5-biscarboxylic acid mononucleotide sulfurtransferase
MMQTPSSPEQNASSLAQKRDALHRAIAESVQPGELLLVAYSGGVDSAYLAWEAHAVLADRMLAVIADSPSLPRKELAAAIEFAQLHSIPLRVVQTSELQSADYARNDTSRCFHCKDELFRVMEDLAQQTSAATKIAYGRNLDDDGDFRPGQHAARQHAVLAPLATAGLGKQDVRALAHQMGLALWDKPASACLASRIEYGRPVTVETLRQVELAEDHLHALGFHHLRVRHHGDLARVEIDRAELPQALSLEMLDRISSAVRACGFQYVALDTNGYRSGAMNEKLIPLQALLRTS